MSAIEDSSSQIDETDGKKEIPASNTEENKLNDEYLSSNHGFENQDPDELMTNEDNEPQNDDHQRNVEKNERTDHHELDTTKQPPDLFTGTFQEESTPVQSLESPHEEADVYLSAPDSKFPQATLSTHLKDGRNVAPSNEKSSSDLNEVTAQGGGLTLSHDDTKSNLPDSSEIHMMPGTVMTSSQESQSSTDSSVVTMQAIDNQGQIYQQQPTYVLLQTTGEQDGSGQPQVFLAMQTGGVAGQDSQAYITLHPVSVEGQEISGTFSTEGLSLQQAVLSQSGISGDVSLELNPNVSLTDVKGLQLSSGIDVSSQMYIPASGQIVTAADSDPSGNGVITYIQSMNSLNGAGQTQVLMAVAEEDSPQMGNAVRIRAKEAAAIAGNLLGVAAPETGSTQVQKAQNQSVAAQSRRRLSNDPRTCDECGRSFKYPSDLKKHLQIHTDMKKFQCEECCRCFRRLHQLNVHKRIHSGEKPYACNRCGAQFRHDSTLTMHIRTRHDHLKPFACDGCGKNFGRMSHLRKHQRNVCGKGAPRNNMFPCKYCDEGFARKSDLRQHFLACEKKPDKPEKDILTPTLYSCDNCGKEFSRNYDYKRHQLSHTDEKPYPCSKCPKNFKEKSSLHKHVKRMHSSLTGDAYMDSSQDESTETETAQRAIATITSSPGDIIVSLAQSMSSSAENDTIATAHALAQAGIIDNADQILQGSHTIAAADILNFPEVAAALGLNTGSQSGHPTMVVTQPVHTSSMIGIDGDHVRIQASGLDDSMAVESHHIEPSTVGTIKQFVSTTGSLQLDSDGLIIDTDEAALNPDDAMMSVEEQHITKTITVTGSIQAANENVITSSANDVNVVNMAPSEHRTVSSEFIKTGSIGNVLTGADAERVAASVGSARPVYETVATVEKEEVSERDEDHSDVGRVDKFDAQNDEIPMSIGYTLMS